MCTFKQSLIVELGTNHTMRADIAAVAALNADVGLPQRYEIGNITLLPLCGAGWISTIHRDHGNWKIITVTGQHRSGHLLHKLGRMRRNHGCHAVTAADPGWHIHLMQVIKRGIYGLEVELNNFSTLFGIGFLNGCFDIGNGLISRQYAGEGKEAGLHDGVDAPAHTRIAGNGRGINHIKSDLFFDNILLNRFW